MAHSKDAYFVPHSTDYWPIVGSIGLVGMVGGFAAFLNGMSIGTISMIFGLIVFLIMFWGWFRVVIKESHAGLYSKQVDFTFRWGMGWFIFSEVMFFCAFFGALFYARNLSLPWISGEGSGAVTHEFLWPAFEYLWPTNGPTNLGGEFESMGPWGLPLINTILLLTSGITLTWAHHAIVKGHRTQVIIGLFLTVLLGAIFMVCQVEEYIHAYKELNLTLETGIYGSTFFMLTGFHGFHVTMGAVMLTVILVRVCMGHFSPENHFAFEACAWYWHFVDVVWLGLFIFVYIM